VRVDGLGGGKEGCASARGKRQSLHLWYSLLQSSAMANFGLVSIPNWDVVDVVVLVALSPVGRIR
jgi:hypothetical protein